ncbi:MAG: hypothetical protein ACK4TA_15630 [Saprospiraceae bacterium]
MKQLIFIAVFIIINHVAQAQISGKSIPELRREALATTPVLMPSLYAPIPALNITSFKFLNAKPSVPIVYSYHNLAFFCKVEVKLEKAVKLPVKFRLGDVEYVDRLEGKRE